MRFTLLITTIISFTVGCWAQSQEPTAILTAEKCFVDAPDDVISLIEKPRRLDMLDYYQAQSDKGTSNIYGGECTIERLQEYPENGSSILEFTSNNGLKYIIFVVNGNTPAPLIGIIEEIPSPILDTQIKFYTKTWEKPTKAIWREPALSDWIINKTDNELVTEALPFIMYSADYDAKTKVLSLTNNMGAYFVKDEGTEILDKLKPKLTYRWDGKQFKSTTK